MKKLPLFLVLLTFIHPAILFAQISLDSSINWSSGLYQVELSIPLPSDISPNDHPNALVYLEQSMTEILINDLEDIPWNNRGTLENLFSTNPQSRADIQQLPSYLERQWSRIDETFTQVEAFYTLQLVQVLNTLLGEPRTTIIPERPIGWIPVPEDDWSGIIVYLSPLLPVRGTGSLSSPIPSVQPRLLGDELQTLTNASLEHRDYPTYIQDTDEPLLESIVGRRPYFAAARELYGELPCDIILSREDTRRLLASEGARDALIQGNVVFMMEREPNGNFP